MESYTARHVREVFLQGDIPADQWPMIIARQGIVGVLEFFGFTAISTALIEVGGTQGIERLRNVIDPFFTGLLTLVAKWNGDVTQIAGDVVTVTWKNQSLQNAAMPLSSSSSSSRFASLSAEFLSVGCCMELAKFVNKYNGTLVGSDIGSKRIQLRVALQGGLIHHVHFGIKGSRREYCVVGPAVASAHSNRRTGKEGEIIVSAPIWHALQRSINVSLIKVRPVVSSAEACPYALVFSGASKTSLDVLDAMKRILRSRRSSVAATVAAIANGDPADQEYEGALPPQAMDSCREYINTSALYQLTNRLDMSFLRTMSSVVIKVSHARHMQG
ncbi:hypothetical protein BC831DRAFT_279772 [Entophlyctis helioformis]|nr:hypothetical protein BC831DRAFT_279772 [Entophlyctis helioformis]